MQCNIDSRGKAIRLMAGAAMLLIAAIGAGLVVLDVLAPWVWWPIGAITAGGLFGMFEGWAGWCAMRAMGFRTRV